jgi:nitrite reductase (NADH) large subunit
VGNGAAGNTAAEQIRKADPEGSITIFCAEDQPFYYRVRLPEVVAGEIGLEKITLHSRAWYEEKGIELLSGRSASEVDIAAGRIRGEEGGWRSFDSLLLAVGARSFVPPVPGAHHEGVHTLRTWADARTIAERADRTDRAILVGGGLLGLETGYGLIRRGVEVEVVEFFPRLLPRQMDAAGAAKLQGHLESMGFSFHLGAQAREIVKSGEGLGLRLEDGRSTQGGLVVFSAGIRPNLDLAEHIGLETDKGVVVDDRLRTSAPDIFAAGDAVEHRGRVYGIWPAAREQGRVAGINMAGGDAEYAGTVISNSLKVAGIDLTSAGEIDPEGAMTSAVYQDDGCYRKIVVDEGRIKGFIFYGVVEGVRECTRALEENKEVSGLIDDMRRKDFDFSRLT